MKNRLFLPKNEKQIKTILNYGFNSFVLPLENYSIGFETYFNLEQIKEISKTAEVYLIINKLFHYDQISEAIKLLNSLDFVKGMIIEDLGLINNLKDKNVILFQNHLNMNYDAINYFYEKGIKNILISNELTIDEIDEIREKTNSELYYFIISKNNIMYSRRKLITNYNNYFNKEAIKNNEIIKEDVTNYELLITETENGTSILNNKVFSGYSCINKLIKNTDYLIYNFSYIEENIAKTIFENIETDVLNEKIEYDDYFLHNEISYKVKEG